MNFLTSLSAEEFNHRYPEWVQALVKEVMSYRAELPGGLFELQNIKSDARAISKRLEDALIRNSQQAIRIGVYERIYGPLRECPGPSSIYPEGQHSHGCGVFYCLLGHHHISGELLIASHTHSLTGGKNDA